MTSEEYERLVENVKHTIWLELKDTIPPSIDIMRDLKFREAAEKAVNLCLRRTNVEVS